MTESRKVKKTNKKRKKALKKIHTDDEVKTRLLNLYGAVSAPINLQRKMTNAFNEILGSTENIRDDASRFLEKHEEDLSDYMKMHTLDTSCLVIEVCDKEYRTFLTHMKDQLMVEFDCKTAAEKSLVQLAVTAYYKYLRFSRYVNSRCEPEWLSHEKASFLKMYSMEADRGFRQYTSAIETLRSLKQPPIKMNVKAENAYMAQNQQVNFTSQDDAQTPNSEINEVQ